MVVGRALQLRGALRPEGDDWIFGHLHKLGPQETNGAGTAPASWSGVGCRRGKLMDVS